MGKNKLITSNYVTIIGKNTQLKGDLECSGSVRVDGKITGNLKLSGHLFVGEEGSINGNISALSVNLAGTITGNIDACDHLRMHSQSRLDGDIRIKNFIVDEGAVFRGKCEMIEDNSGADKHSKKDKKKIFGDSASEVSKSQK
jgi:cytoskeletal protein CcmA (bactofilin family)